MRQYIVLIQLYKMFHKKTTANFITITFAVLIIVQVFGFLMMNISNDTADFASANFEQGSNPLDNLQVKIPGIEKISSQHVTCNDDTCSVPWIGIYISAIYRYAVSIVGLLATVVMMFAGMLWITAAGNTEQISKAKSYISAALTGLVLTLTSWVILYQVNPDLIKFTSIKIVPVEKHTPESTTNETCKLLPKETPYKFCNEKFPGWKTVDDNKCPQYNQNDYNGCCCKENEDAPVLVDPSISHMACIVERTIPGNGGMVCVSVPGKGTNECSIDQDCLDNMEVCCLSNYKILPLMGYRDCSTMSNKDCKESGGNINLNATCKDHTLTWGLTKYCQIK